MTSTEVLGAAKRLFSAQKAGHAGTLDPLATGLLPIAFGEATKTVSFAMDGVKSYRFTVRWGLETATDDAEGEIIAESSLMPSASAIKALIPCFVGQIMQTPPQYSAIKVAGSRAYDLARGGHSIALSARPVNVDDLKLIEAPDASTAVFEASCGKGTYVRALVRDMGRGLGTYGHVIALRRTRVGPFEQEDAVTFDTLHALQAGNSQVALHSALKPVEAALQGITGISIDQADAAALARGQSVLMRGRDAPVVAGQVYATSKGRLVALGEVDKGAIRPTRVFNFAD